MVRIDKRGWKWKKKSAEKGGKVDTKGEPISVREVTKAKAAARAEGGPGAKRVQSAQACM